MMKKNMIRKMIIAAAMVLTMLPVQAEASSASEIVKDDFKIIVSDFKKGSDSLGENPTVTEKNVQITYLEEGKYKLSYQVKLEGPGGSYEMQEPANAIFVWNSCVEKLSEPIPQTVSGSDYSWKLTVTRESCAAHQVEKIQKESNCTEQGYEKDGCVRCAYTVENTKIPKDLKADKHDYTWKTDENGSQMHICSYNEAHNGICGGGQEATCTAKSVCDICKKEYGIFAHEMAYTSDGAVITESCAKGCGHSATATLVLDPAVSRVYSGSEIKPLRVEYSANWEGGELAIHYHNNTNATTESSKARGEISKGEGNAEVTFEIGKAYMNNVVVSGDYQDVYDGKSHRLEITGAPDNAVITYSVDGGSTYTAENPEFKDVGMAVVFCKIESENYDTYVNSKTFSISPRELRVTAEAEIAYGEAVPEIQAVYDGFVAGESSAIVTDKPILTHEYVQFMDAGDYNIQVNADHVSVPNYSVKAENGMLTVKKRELTVAWDAMTFTYDGEVKKPKATVTGIVNEDDVQFAVEGEGTDAGTYTAKVSITGSKSVNYELLDNSEIQFVIEKATQKKPENLKAVNESILNKGDGGITGVTADMEYKIKGSDKEYEKISESTALTSGVYLVRYAEKKPNYTASPDTEVAVSAEKVLTVSVPENPVGYTLTADPVEVGWKGQSKLTFQLLDGYSAEGLVIKLGDESITLKNDNTYTIKDIQENKIVTVEGIVDQLAPEAVITVTGKNTENVERISTALVDNVTFEDFFKQIKVTIAGTDASGIKSIEYYESAVKVDDPAIITTWKPYPEKGFTVNGNDRNLMIYAKVIDNSGKETYVSSNGMVFDRTPPVIKVNGKLVTETRMTCYTTKEVTVTDDNMNEVRLNGVAKTSPIALAGNINKPYLIRTEDKAGNENGLTITMKPIDTLDDSIAEITVYNMDPDDADKVEKVQKEVDKLYKSATVEAEKKLLKDILDNCEKLLEIQHSITTKEANLKWTKGTKKTLIVAADGKLDGFEKLLIDDEVVPATNYTKKSTTKGTSITLKYTYLEKLKVGKHSIQMVYKDGKTNVANLEILNSNPKTGDSSHLAVWLLTGAVSFAGLTAVVCSGRKRKHQV